MSNLNEIAALISSSLPFVKRGTPRLFGVWFGKPYDNWYTIIGCHVIDSHLIIYFDNDMLLHVWSPSGVTCNKEIFKIVDADKVRLEWCLNRQPRPLDACFMELVKRDGALDALPRGEGLFSIFRPSLEEPAVEVL